MNNKKVKNILIISWILLIVVGVILFVTFKPRLLKDDTVDFNQYLTDDEEYNLALGIEFESTNAPLYLCNTQSIPSYIDELAQTISSAIEREDSSELIQWKYQDSIVLTYDLDTTVLSINLNEYPEAIKFSSVERFLANYLNPKIEYAEMLEETSEDMQLYRGNRIVNGEIFYTGYGYSDFYLVQDGYLYSARVLLADISKTNTFVPMIDSVTLNNYLSNPEYPKNIILDTSDVITVDEQTYETFNPEFNYEQCNVNSVEPVIYFVDCTKNYISYSYQIEGVCDIEYDNALYSVPFQGFINAIDPEYVKSIE